MDKLRLYTVFDADKIDGKIGWIVCPNVKFIPDKQTPYIIHVNKNAVFSWNLNILSNDIFSNDDESITGAFAYIATPEDIEKNKINILKSEYKYFLHVQGSKVNNYFSVKRNCKKMEKDLKEIKRLKDESKLDYKIRILTLKKNYVLEQKKVKEYRAAIKEYGKLISAKVTEIKNAETKE